ncbi:D-2-hydroxyacid dehydrogenase family protein [Mucilaginibacter paludis]|uniref:D-isomer specific 2-hydroxyacid dehydrogenase NAD-binding n=1 Tax=Mucilaginibacter paludis DSM 18603 TaxID=714943 RepID=H1YBF4_9SPHI|nr:D-2-hydroxyacid dehydrogenase family protein [Mucilaginibacter paludis]EHQ31208.1 D-isomer specific 2-hydroxyacid dehydrogenase NAD-binding [Mucilaginibacter paludis DSM 18603]
MNSKIQIAVLDDYQQVATATADWSEVQRRAQVTIFHDHLFNETEVINRLLPFDVVCVMRERTPLNRNILSQLPNLKVIVSTGKRNASIDVQAAEEFNIRIMPTGYIGTGAPEMTWAMLMAITRHIPLEAANVRSGGWQTTIAADLTGKTLGIIGLGNIGAKMAVYAKAFDMNVIAWSQNLTEEKAAASGAKLVTKEELFSQADFVTIHLVLSDRSRGIVGEVDLNLMKPTAYFINTSRGPLADEQALIKVLEQKKIAGAALDVFETEPLPPGHPFRKLDNVLATPHIGYVTENTYKLFYEDTVKAILKWLDTVPENS